MTKESVLTEFQFFLLSWIKFESQPFAECQMEPHPTPNKKASGIILGKTLGGNL